MTGPSALRQLDDISASSGSRPDWRDGPLTANVWLLFLAFPLVSVLVGDASPERTAALVGLIVLFALVHVVGYQAAFRRNHSEREDVHELSIRDPLNAVPYFAALVTIMIVAVLLGGPA